MRHRRLHRRRTCCSRRRNPIPKSRGLANFPNGAPTPDAVAEQYFRRARDAWSERTDVPFVHYGALIRYEHNKHVFNNWWDAYFRPKDGELALERLTDPDEDRKRLAGRPVLDFRHHDLRHQ